MTISTIMYILPTNDPPLRLKAGKLLTYCSFRKSGGVYDLLNRECMIVRLSIPKESEQLMADSRRPLWKIGSFPFINSLKTVFQCLRLMRR